MVRRLPLPDVAPPHSRHRRGHAESGQMPVTPTAPGHEGQLQAGTTAPAARSSTDPATEVVIHNDTVKHPGVTSTFDPTPHPAIRPRRQPAHSHRSPDGGSVRVGPSVRPGSGRQGRPNRDDQRTTGSVPARVRHRLLRWLPDDPRRVRLGDLGLRTDGAPRRMVASHGLSRSHGQPGTSAVDHGVEQSLHP